MELSNYFPVHDIYEIHWIIILLLKLEYKVTNFVNFSSLFCDLEIVLDTVRLSS